MGNGVPAHSQLRLVDGGQRALLLAPGPQRRLHGLLAAGEAGVGVDHPLHLCGERGGGRVKVQSVEVGIEHRL